MRETGRSGMKPDAPPGTRVRGDHENLCGVDVFRRDTSRHTVAVGSRARAVRNGGKRSGHVQ